MRPTVPNSKSKIGQELVRALSEGISAYLTYEARCGMSPAYCEQFVYAPFVRIAKNLHWKVNGEVPVNKKSGEKVGAGDYKRVDFVFTRNNGGAETTVALEVKYLKPRKNAALNIVEDIKKLSNLQKAKVADEGYLLVVGKFISGAHPKIAGKQLNQPSMKFFIDASKSSYGVAAYKI